MAVVLASAALTYGGVSLFVVAFAVFPVAAALFRQAEVPHRLIPPAIALGAFTFTMTALPGTPAIQNAIPMSVFRHHAVCGAGSRHSQRLRSSWASACGGCALTEMHARRAGEGYSFATPRELPTSSSCASAQRTRTISTLPNCRTAIEASNYRPLRCRRRPS